MSIRDVIKKYTVDVEDQYASVCADLWLRSKEKMCVCLAVFSLVLLWRSKSKVSE